MAAFWAPLPILINEVLVSCSFFLSSKLDSNDSAKKQNVFFEITIK